MSMRDEPVQPADVAYARESRYIGRRDDQLAEADSLHLWSFVRRNWGMIAASAVVVAAAAMIVTTRITPTYVATASVRIDQKSWQLPALDALGFTQGNALATELEILRGRVLAEEVVDSLGLQLSVRRPGSVPRARLFARVAAERAATAAQYRLTAERGGGFALIDRATGARVQQVAPGQRIDAPGISFYLADSAPALVPVDLELRTFRSAVADMRRGLDISRRNRDAEIIDVSYRGHDPELASEIVNVLARRFVEGRQDLRRAEALSAVRFLGDQIARVSEQLDAAERALQEFRERENVVNLPEEASSGVRGQAELQAQRHALDAERTALAALLDGARTTPPRDGELPYRSLLAFPTLLRSGMAAELMTALVGAEEQRNELRARRTVNDPDLQILDARITQLHSEIRALVSTYVEGLTRQVSALDAALARDGARLRSIPRKELRLAELERSATSSAETYSMLLTRLKEAQIAAAASDLTVRVVEPAVAPTRPVAPRPMINLAIALVVGTALGGVVGLARELSDRSIHSRRDLLARTGVPVLGIIPRAVQRGRLSMGRSMLQELVETRVRALLPGDRWRTRAKDSRDGGRDAEGAKNRSERLYSFTASDAFAWLATNIAFVRREPPIRVLVVTSPLSGDGKTTVAANLALTFARNGRRVLLIDADLRAGRIAAGFKLARAPGLSDWLADGADREVPVNRFGLASGASLDVVVAGSATTIAAQLLASDRLRELIDWARLRYDFTIIDTAPVNVAADAALVSPESDGVVIVARAGVTEREAVEFAVEQLMMVRAPIAGAVLNDVDVRRDGAYDRTYRYYGQYASSQT